MPKISQNLFNRKKLASILENISTEELADNAAQCREIITNWCELLREKLLEEKNEISLHGEFLSDFFGRILDYKAINESPSHLSAQADKEWHRYSEKKTIADSTRSDAALGFFSPENDDVRVIVELKNAKTDLDVKQNRKGLNETPVGQAFAYANKSGKNCKWIIVSNYREIRLYRYSPGMTEYEVFFIEKLQDEFELKKFLYLLSRKNLIDREKDSEIDRLYADNEAEQEKISKEFYSKYKNLRLRVFQHFKEKNNNHSDLILLEKTQKFLDRFIFICYCQNLGLLPKDIFRKITKAVTNPTIFVPITLWDQLKNFFRTIDKGSHAHNINKFNGGLFEFDEILDAELFIGDEIFKELLEISAYDFESDLNVNILGHIFEQSISDIEELKASIAGKSFDKKKGKRKKHGIYYTPEYITRYIVEQAVGCWLEDRKKELGFETLPELTEKDFKAKKIPKKIKLHLDFWDSYQKKLSNIKILDPACGSGAFLNQAFDYLYKEGQYVNEQIANLQKGQAELFNLDKHILQNNLFGVDLNPESVEITKLSLWLKTANKNSELTSLDKNIKCGNSLIDDPEIAGDRAFKWENEFPEIMQNGGFDVLVGNPPYVRQELLTQYKAYLETKYQCYSGTTDLFSYFYEKSLLLLKTSGYLGFISNIFTKTTGAGEKLRHFLKNNSKFLSIADFSGQKIFEGITTYPIIPILKKEKSLGSFNYLRVKKNDLTDLASAIKQNSIIVEQALLRDDSWSFESETEQNLKKKISEYKTVREIFGKCYRGIVTGLNEAFIISGDKRDEIIANNPREAEIIKPFLEGKDIKKWHTPTADKWLIFTQRGIDINHYPFIKKELLHFKEKLIPKKNSHKKIGRKPGKYEWFEIQDTVAYYNFFETPKIFWPNLQSDNKFAFDTEGFYINAPSVILPTASKVMLCIINSKLAWFFFENICVLRSGGYIELKPQYVDQLPVCLPCDEKPLSDKADTMLAKNKELHELKTDFLNFLKSELNPAKISKKLENWHKLDWESFKKELKKCKAKDSNLQERKEWLSYFTEKKEKAAEIQKITDRTDKEIDRMVYELYGLTEDEIHVVENSR